MTNNPMTSCVINYPVSPSQELVRLPLATRLRVAVLDPADELQSLAYDALNSDAMLDITHSHYTLSEPARFHVALVYIPHRATDKLTVLQHLTPAISHIIIVSDELTSEIARLSVQFKVDDLIPLSDLSGSLYPALSSIAATISQQVSVAPLTSIINGKAGSGATFLTCCLSEIHNAHSHNELALIDADFNFGSLAHGLHAESRYSIDEALAELHKLDEAAIRSMMTTSNGIKLIGNAPFSRLQQSSESCEQFDRLCWKIRQTFGEVFVDMSKGLEQHTLPILNQSSTILIVMQLSVACLRETKAILQAMRRHASVDDKNIAIVVNRYVTGKGEIQLADVTSVLGVSNIFTISNNFELARLRTDLGRSLNSLANHKTITRELHQIVHFIAPNSLRPTIDKAGFFSRLLRSK
ncbi:AAA family ATPase [Salinimonas lutimaris]|uniref:AAA family ATPase n=1 Tax=Salinimonas lutimaris TaxID=914153 RepID=UPI0010C13359|nr:hypothetical protein [Salinimonas lutimaris]